MIKHKINTLWPKLKISLLLPPMAFGLWALGLQRTLSLLQHVPNWRRPVNGVQQASVAQHCGQMMRWAKRRALYRGNCLSQSVLLWWLLQRRDIHTQLRVGVRQHQGAFQAHAWVEYQGAALNAGPRVRQKYTAFEYAFGKSMD